ncbi:MAG: polymorphic toxin type 35 domain-containing protein [Anaerocolumna sp.]
MNTKISPFVAYLSTPPEGAGKGIFNGVDEAVLKDTVRKHVFSDKHIKSGIMELGESQNDILSKGFDIIKEIDSKNMLIEGSTQIKTYINGLETEIRIFVKDGKVINYDMFKGWSPRDMGTTIYH